MKTLERQKFLTMFCFTFAAIVLAASIALLFMFKPFLEWYFENVDQHTVGGYTDLLVGFYTAYAICFIAVSLLMRILWNVAHGRLFVRENTNLFRIISYLAFAVAIICLIFTFKYISLFILGMGILFGAFLLQVLVQVFAAAADIKGENDLTI